MPTTNIYDVTISDITCTQVTSGTQVSWHLDGESQVLWYLPGIR